MRIRVIKTISGQYQIVDADDEDAPLVEFHNEYNKEEIAKKVVEVLSTGVAV